MISMDILRDSIVKDLEWVHDCQNKEANRKFNPYSKVWDDGWVAALQGVLDRIDGTSTSVIQ